MHHNFIFPVLVIYSQVIGLKLLYTVNRENQKCNENTDVADTFKENFLGKYKHYAVAADNYQCSTVGKYFRKNKHKQSTILISLY